MDQEIKTYVDWIRVERRALRELIALGYIKKHPAGGETTYELDERGFETCRKIREQRKAR